MNNKISKNGMDLVISSVVFLGGSAYKKIERAYAAKGQEIKYTEISTIPLDEYNKKDNRQLWSMIDGMLR